MKLSDINVFALPIHPMADILPMMNDDELLELATNIEAVGLLHPIIVAQIDGTLTLVDGRNRRSSCLMTEVSPAIKKIAADKVTNYIESANLLRRNINTGQKAMAQAILHPDVEKGGRGINSPIPEGLFRRVSEARIVLKYADELAASVLDKSMSLNKAYQTAMSRRYEPEAKVRGKRVTVPEDETLETATRKGLAAEADGSSIRAAAPVSGLGKDTYNKMRRIVQLADMADSLSDEDKIIVAEALHQANEHAMISGPSHLIKNIGNKMLGETNRPNKIGQKIEQLARAASILSSNCRALNYLDVPFVPSIQREEILEDIADALRPLMKLQRQLKGMDNAKEGQEDSMDSTEKHLGGVGECATPP